MVPKMLSPAFPPRRPSGIIRYALVTAAVLLILYMYTSSRDGIRPTSIPVQTDPNLSQKPRPGSLNDESPLINPSPSGQSPSNSDHTSSNTPKPNIHEVDMTPKPKPRPRPDTHTETEDTLGKDKPAVDSNKPGTGRPKPAVDLNKPSPGKPKPNDEFSSEEITSDGSSFHSGKFEMPPAENDNSLPTGPEDVHPIDTLIYDAQHTFAELLSKESKTIEEAAQAYRKRRGRHPPPGFDRWFEFAQANNALIVEDFFDQIYEDLNPFWGMEPASMRKNSWDYEMTINIRDGKATTASDWFWTVIWLDLIKTVEHLLPDMDLAINAMDEPRIVVPHEEIVRLMKKAEATKNLATAASVRSDSQKLPPPGQGDLNTVTEDKAWEGTNPYWIIARRGCPADSLARTTGLQESFVEPPDVNMTYAAPHMHEGFVGNYTLSTDLCHQPDLQGLEGILIEPLTTSATKVLFPMFGGSKLSVNNEILLPPPMYWNEEERFTGGDDHGVPWSVKVNQAIWRGVATGGWNRAKNWRGFQRHRFVAMNNGTKLTLVEGGAIAPENFGMPEGEYKVKAQDDKWLGKWVGEWADVFFVDLMCNEDDKAEDGSCPYTSPHYETRPGLKMSEQFDAKFVPDIDGNSFSGRYIGFLRSTSLPIKATLWREWHDSRLVAWKHFVPMDSRFLDYYGIMEYFLGYKGKGAHDRAAEKIAMDGKEWAEKVLRKEDMQVYVLRLLLEYGRVIDDRRETLGWVEDVLANPSLEVVWRQWK